jgi:hypothetical protein
LQRTLCKSAKALATVPGSESLMGLQSFASESLSSAQALNLSRKRRRVVDRSQLCTHMATIDFIYHPPLCNRSKQNEYSSRGKRADREEGKEYSRAVFAPSPSRSKIVPETAICRRNTTPQYAVKHSPAGALVRFFMTRRSCPKPRV